MRARASIAAAFFFASLASSAQEPVPLRYGQAFSAVRSIYSLPIFVADREGFFAREGLAFTNILIPGGGENMIGALDDGTVELSHVATPFLVHAALGGSDAVAIAAEFDDPVYSLVARPTIRDYADLKGHVVGMADEAGTIAYSMWKLLDRHGLRPADVQVKIISGTPQRLSCLTRGPCDAVPLGQPEDFVALGEGYRRLGFSNEAVPRFLYTVTAARRGWAAAHGDVVAAYVRALAASFRFIRDPAMRDRVIATIVATEAVPAEAARQTLALFLEPGRHVLPRAGEIDMDGFARVIAFMRESGTIDGDSPAAARFVDLRYLRAAGIE